MKTLFSIFGLGQNLTFSLSTLLIGKAYCKAIFSLAYWLPDKAKIFEPNNRFFQKYDSSLEVQRAKGKFSDNSGQNILEPYNDLLQMRSETSKTNLDI